MSKLKFKSVSLDQKTFNNCFSRDNLFHHLRYAVATHKQRMKEIGVKTKQLKFYTTQELYVDEEYSEWWFKYSDKWNVLKILLDRLKVKEVYKIDFNTNIITENIKRRGYKGNNLSNCENSQPPKRMRFASNQNRAKDLYENSYYHTNTYKYPIHGHLKTPLDDKRNGFNDNRYVKLNPSSILLDFFYKNSRILIYKYYTDIIISSTSDEISDIICIEINLLLNNIVKEIYDEIPKKITYSLNFITQSNTGLRLRNQIVEPNLNLSEDNYLGKYYNDEILDFHTNLIDNINDGGLYLIHGDPGGGKSTYLKYLSYVLDNKDKKIVYLPAGNVNLLNNPGFMDFALSSLSNTLLIIEDAEEIIQHCNRRSTATSALLQLTDGLMGDSINCTVIATFNTNLENIDEALKRGGRLKNRIEIKELSEDKIKALKEEFNIPEENKGKTLAELFNNKDNNRNIKKERPSIGFKK